MKNEKENEILNRLYNVIPVGTLHMQEMLNLMSIKLTRDVKITNSACITCEIRPTLYLNIDFIDEYCKTNEHLFMLVMHELYHKILGHTTLFKKHTLIDNIAFDAIINAMLCKEYPSEEYISFFKNLNSSRKMPECLLRPMADDTPSEVRILFDDLYYKNSGTYYEVFLLLKKEIENALKDKNIILIGNHNGLGDLIDGKVFSTEDNDDLNDKMLGEFIDEIISKWPKPPDILRGRDKGLNLHKERIISEREMKMQKNLRTLLKKANIITGVNEQYKKSFKETDFMIETFVPNFLDRTFVVKNELLKSVLLFNKNEKLTKPAREDKVKAFVYLDVSGSVYLDLKRIMPVLKKLVKKKEIEMYQFSTKVTETDYDDFVNGNVNTTGGTDVNCIFKHYFEIKKCKRPDKILILTDGYVGKINDDYINDLKKDRVKVYVGLFGGYYFDNLKDVAKLMLTI